jgi:hypothetical protein
VNLDKDWDRESYKHEIGEDVENSNNKQLIEGLDTFSYGSRSVSRAIIRVDLGGLLPGSGKIL